MSSYGGKCVSGPYDGQMWAYPKKTMPVVWIDGAFMREGVYEFGDGIWRWNGPTYRPSAPAIFEKPTKGA